MLSLVVWRRSKGLNDAAPWYGGPVVTQQPPPRRLTRGRADGFENTVYGFIPAATTASCPLGELPCWLRLPVTNADVTTRHGTEFDHSGALAVENTIQARWPLKTKNWRGSNFP